MTERKKYPKTPHVPWSTGTSDDKTLVDDKHFHDKWVIASLKMDGENTTIYTDGMHARSLERPMHPSQSWVKKLAGDIGYRIPEDVRVCGENLYAKHTVPYSNLDSYFMVFSVWLNEKCMNWLDTQNFVKDLDLIMVPTIYIGPYDKNLIMQSYEPFKQNNEGYVIRNADAFSYDTFDENVMKYVNPGFRQALKESTVHWASAEVIPNKLKQ